ncbi:MAG: peptidoglycan DD-metalloendopeptidase family protein [Pyrinomonadaceae bacterium]|nr:peptidoglycan DD-metalloendopeptidase family protein [Pyrinomonadaceae bacterium]
MEKIIFCLSLGLFFAITAFGQTSSEKVQKMVELFVSAYNAKDYAQIEQQFNAQMRAAITTDKLKEFFDNLHADSGKIIKLGSPNFSAPTAANFPAAFERGKWVLLIALDAEGKFAGFRVTPPLSDKPKNTSRNQTKLSLPFKGEWFVVWGGDTPEQNQHRDAPNQRFAFDIVKTGASGKTHKGDGAKNEDFYAFGQEIIAPADGTIVYLVDGVHDNKPGEMNRMYVPGNLVIIKHAENEYSLFAHFKQNSIRVKVGDKITRGQTIGLCGNSGNSSEPHLHFQMQNTAFFEDEASMKTFFEKITVKRDGKNETKTNYSPVKGDVVSQD